VTKKWNSKVVGLKIRCARKNRNWTQQKLANETGISADWISHIECGRRLPSLSIAVRLSDALNVHMDFILDR
jgi:transcriptional regulator with XRE-family HTH domain